MRRRGLTGASLLAGICAAAFAVSAVPSLAQQLGASAPGTERPPGDTAKSTGPSTALSVRQTGDTTPRTSTGTQATAGATDAASTAAAMGANAPR